MAFEHLKSVDIDQLNCYKNRIFGLSPTQFTTERMRLLQLINGDVFFKLSKWPKSMKRLFFKKPHSDKETSVLLYFLIGKKVI